MKILTTNPKNINDYFLDVAKALNEIVVQQSVSAEIYYVGDWYENLHLAVVPDDKNLLIVVGADLFVENCITTEFEANFLELQKFAKNNPNKQIISVHSGISPAEFFCNTNIIPLSAGTDMMMHHKQNKDILPVTEKKFQEPYHWISCSANPRTHRLLSAMVIAGLDLDRFGLLKISPYLIEQHSSWIEWYPKEINNIDPRKSQILETGFYRLKNFLAGGQDYHHIRELDIAERFSANFNNHGLRERYENSVVEIINDNGYFKDLYNLSEKTLQSFFGHVFPILLAPSGAVDYLRSIGFDMFDDIINHTYDTISDPITRVFAMIEDNRKILTNRDYAVECWYACRDRMNKNVDFINNQMYDRLLTSTKVNFNNLLTKVQHS